MPVDHYDIEGLPGALPSFSLTRPLHLWAHASFWLSACNGFGRCVDSPPVDTVTALAESVGYVKASNTAASAQFGTVVALSGDGHTLAVGVPREDSGAVGINGNQTYVCTESAGDHNCSRDSGAVYVYARIDSDFDEVWVQEAYIKAGVELEGGRFGSSVALSSDGNILAVGAPGFDHDTGAGYVFERNQLPSSQRYWSPQGLGFLRASNADQFDHFGSSVALSADGTIIAVGAPRESSAATGVIDNMSNEALMNNDAAVAGAVYVFDREVPGWNQIAFVKASNTDALDCFGESVALSSDGGVLAVGAPSERGNGTSPENNDFIGAGAVYVYSHSDGVWEGPAYIKALPEIVSNSGSAFGSSVAISGDGGTLAVGAPKEAYGDIAEGGAVYIYQRGGGWMLQDRETPPAADHFDWFGRSLALSEDGSILAVGTDGEDSNSIGVDGGQSNNSAEDSGAVYIFRRGAMAWSRAAHVKAPYEAWLSLFGWSVALSADGETMAVGAPHENGGATGIGSMLPPQASARESGAVYLY